ncbi:hypothetical protein AgCh_019911 [Apium graveolens]
MALSLQTSSSSSCLHSRSTPSHSSLSCATKVFVGLRLQSPTSYGISRPNLNVEFHNKVHKSIESRACNGKPNRSRARMMPIGTPRVPYRTPGEGSWQWVDLWNALLTPSMAIYDTMQSLKSPVGTHCVGYAYNLAGFLLAAGEKGNRNAMLLSRVALQSPAGAARGQADDIRNEANELLRIRDYLFKELSQKTGQPEEKIYNDLSRMKRFNAQEALEYGLIDRIVRPPRIKADAVSRNAGTGLG